MFNQNVEEFSYRPNTVDWPAVSTCAKPATALSGVPI